MQTYSLIRTQHLRAPHRDVFAFFQAPENLSRLTPPWLAFNILTPRPLVMATGARFDYKVRWLGLSIGWTTVIREYDPPVRFVDEQLRGPYALWHHTHDFRKTPEGTQMTDTVRYALPLGPLGSMVHLLVVRRQLQEIFEFRQRAIAEVFDNFPEGPAEQ